jgi:hypothetical protein
VVPVKNLLHISSLALGNNISGEVTLSQNSEEGGGRKRKKEREQRTELDRKGDGRERENSICPLATCCQGRSQLTIQQGPSLLYCNYFHVLKSSPLSLSLIL